MPIRYFLDKCVAYQNWFNSVDSFSRRCCCWSRLDCTNLNCAFKYVCIYV